MVDMKMGTLPPFFPPYAMEYAPPSGPSASDLSRYLGGPHFAPPEVGTYWPDCSYRCDTYYHGADSTPTRATRQHPPPSPASSRALQAQRTHRSARAATNASPTATGAGDVVSPSASTSTTASAARGAQFTIIANVPYDTVRQDLVSEFRKFGRVELAMVVCDEASRHPHKEWTSTAGYAFVRFSKRSEAHAAIQAATMGLITIRGTRVRADWARKDSYAKRGRVSPAQGAPSLNPMGVPDGITLLQDSLNRAGARNQWSMYRDLSNSPSAPGTKLDPPGWVPAKATDIESPTAPNEQALQVLEDVLQALELIPQKASSYQNKSSNDTLAGRPADQVSSAVPATPNPDPSFYCRAVGGSRAESKGTSRSEEETSPGVVSSVIAQELASGLSPASRGLLTVALSDVAAGDAFTDVSPMAQGPSTNHARNHFNSPEELLHQTVQHLSVATASPASTAASTRKGPLGPGGALGASTASDFSSLSEIEDIQCSEGSLTPPL